LPCFSINGDGYGLLVIGRLKSIGVSSRNISVRSNLSVFIRIVSPASVARRYISISRYIRIVGLGIDSILSNKFKGIVHQSTVATVVSERSGATDKVLFRERY
jgi:hypothetical protein